MDSSKNEILIAIFLGILIGFISVLTFYFIFKNRMRAGNGNKTTVNLNEKGEKAKTKSITQNFDLIIDPEDKEIISGAQTFTLKGSTDKNATLIVQTDDSTKTMKPDREGNFEISLDLKPEVNQVFVTSILDGSQEKTIEKIIYYEQKQ